VIGLRIALALFFVSVCQAGAAPPSWPHDRSDIPPDPAVHWGQLPNGLRYALRPNAEPQGRVSLRLLIEVGSIHEADHERGLAHFLEHMAFRSTADQANGALIESLQRLGIGFGPDNTAFTTFDYTIYHLELPDPSTATLRQALGVFRAYADRLTFSESDIKIERGVVLSEMSTRDSPAYRAGNANLEFLIPESIQSARAVIGVEDQLRRFNAAQLRAFYDAWYRPERMIISVVGQIEPAAVETLLTEMFSSLEARGPARPEPSLTREHDRRNQDQVLVFEDAKTVGLGISLERATPEPQGPPTREQRVKDLHSSLAFHMLQKRFERLAMRRGTSFIAPQVSSSTGIRGWKISSIYLPSKLLAWRLLLSEADQELRRALQFGFTDAELRDAKTFYRTFYEQGVRSAPTAPSESLATQLVLTLAYDNVFANPQIYQDEYQPIAAAATLDQCLVAFRETWGDEQPKVFVHADAHFNASARDFEVAYAYSQRIEVLPPVARAKTQFAYTDFGPPGAFVSQQHVQDLDLWLTELTNRAHFNFKQTDFEADTVLVTLAVGHGRLTQPKDKPGLDLLGYYGLLAGGLGRHDNTEMNDILNGHVISLNFAIGTDTFAFSMQCAPRELLLGLQTLTAILTDSGYRPEAVRSARAGYGSIYEGYGTSPGGPISLNAPRILSQGDPRFSVPPMDVLTSRTLVELNHWLTPEFTQGPLEVSIVGDIDFETASAAIAQTIGALPPREAGTKQPLTDSVTMPDPPAAPYVWPIDPHLRRSAVGFYWPVRDAIGVPKSRRCLLVARVLEERLRLRIREELGVAYSVSAQFVELEGFPGQSYFQVYSEVDPQRANEVDQLIRHEVAAMRREGITPDEFDRSKQPFLTSRTADLRQNSYWGYTVLRDAQRKPDRLPSARDRAPDTQSITVGEIQSLIDHYLTPEGMFAFRTFPSL